MASRFCFVVSGLLSLLAELPGAKRGHLRGWPGKLKSQNTPCATAECGLRKVTCVLSYSRVASVDNSMYYQTCNLFEKEEEPIEEPR